MSSKSDAAADNYIFAFVLTGSSAHQGKETALHEASGKGHMEVVKLLLERGADVHAKEKNDETPLHVATGRGHTEIVKLLLERGADVHAKGKVLTGSLSSFFFRVLGE